MTNYHRRETNRKGNIFEVASQALKNAKCFEDCDEWRKHKNARVRMLAWNIGMKLPYKIDLPKAVTELKVDTSELDMLIERFKLEGKKDPLKSARASMAATAKKRASVITNQSYDNV